MPSTIEVLRPVQQQRQRGRGVLARQRVDQEALAVAADVVLEEHQAGLNNPCLKERDGIAGLEHPVARRQRHRNELLGVAVGQAERRRFAASFDADLELRNRLGVSARFDMRDPQIESREPEVRGFDRRRELGNSSRLKRASSCRVSSGEVKASIRMTFRATAIPSESSQAW
jgi:hypothetical protein